MAWIADSRAVPTQKAIRADAVGQAQISIVGQNFGYYDYMCRFTAQQSLSFLQPRSVDASRRSPSLLTCPVYLPWPFPSAAMAVTVTRGSITGMVPFGLLIVLLLITLQKVLHAAAHDL